MNCIILRFYLVKSGILSAKCQIILLIDFSSVFNLPSKIYLFTFATLKIISLSLVFFLFGSFLYLSKAQGLAFFDSAGHPVDGLIVSVHEKVTGKDKIYITDQKGAVSLDQTPPVTIRTFHFAFQTYSDTLFNRESKTFILKSNNVILKEVSITGNYGLTDHSLYNTEVITREQIESKAACNLSDLFVHQLNARIANDPATGSSVTIQGIGGENIKILVDGVPVIGRLYNNINPSQLNLNNVSRVEIIKGPASALYGTNALGGVVNIITDASTNEKLKTGINAYYESTGQYNFDAFANFHIGKTKLSVTGGNNFFDGWSEIDTSRFKEWKPKEQFFGNVRASQFFNKTRVTLQTGFFDEKVTDKSATLRGWPYDAYALDDYFKTIRFNNNVQVNHVLNESRSLQLTAAYSFYRYIHETHRKDFLDLTDSLISKDPNDFGAGMVRIVYTKDNKDKFNYQAGIDANEEYTSGKRISNYKQQVGDYAVFASVQYKLFSSLVISPAIRAAYNTTYTAPVLPSLQSIFTVNPNIILRASYSHGFRSPSLKELYLDFTNGNHPRILGNPFLTAENSNHILASADLTKKTGKVTLSLSPSFFYNNISNKITLAAQEKNYTYVNLLKYVTKGGQITAGFSMGNLELNSGISYTFIYNQLDDVNTNVSFLKTAEFNSSVEYKIKKSNTHLAAYWKYNGRQPIYTLDENNVAQYFKGESFSMVDISIVQPFWKKMLTVGAGIKNILDVTKIKSLQQSGTHQAMDDYALTGMGRSVFVRIQLQLSK